MIEEAIAWLRLTCSRRATQLGYRREAAALRVKRRRCAGAWDPHLAATREALLQCAGQSRNGHAVLIGAGALHDVPLDGLLECFGRVTLVDVVFHPEARAAARLHRGRVFLAQADVTGAIAPLARQPGVVPAAAPGLPASVVDDASWIASINVLTQLPLLLQDRLLAAGVAEDAVDAFGIATMTAHLRWLAALPMTATLITEFRDCTFAGDGTPEATTDRSDLLAATLPRATALLRWSWQLHPPGELADGRTEVRDVVCLHLPAGGGH